MDVSTRWNSTYNMLGFAIQYQWAIEHITFDWRNDLQEFKLLEDKWEMVEELHDSHMTHGCTEQYMSDLEGCDSLLLAWNSQPAYCDPSHGSH